MSDTMVPGVRNTRVYKDGVPGPWTQSDSEPSRREPTVEGNPETVTEAVDRIAGSGENTASNAGMTSQSTDHQNGY